MKTTKRVLLPALLVMTLVLSGCVGIPDRSKPQLVSTFQDKDGEVGEISPKPDQPSDFILTDMLLANSYPSARHKSSRNFMTQDASEEWDDSTITLIATNIIVNVDNQAPNNASQITYLVRGTVQGRLESGGEYVPSERHEEFEEKVEMTKVKGQWRVSKLRDGVIMDRAEFYNNYEVNNLYYFDKSSKFLSPDRRWFFKRTSNFDSVLLSNLIGGASPGLRNAVEHFVPESSAVEVKRTSEALNINLTGTSSLKPENRDLLAAQIIWTLSDATVRGPYTITADGVPLASNGKTTWTVDDVSQYAPLSSNSSPLYAIVDGKLYESSQGEARAVNDAWGTSGNLLSASLDTQNSIRAGVFADDENSETLVVGSAEQGFNEILTAQSVGRPSWAGDDTFFYVVVEGRTVLRITRSTSTGETTESEVGADWLRDFENPDTRIESFRVSRDGTRAVMIIDGIVYLSIINYDSENNQYNLSKPLAIARDIGSSAVSVEWRPDYTLVVGTNNYATPLWSITVDGSQHMPLASGNVAAPVTNIASSAQTIYITDERTMLQLSTTSEEDDFWREIPEFVGYKGVPILLR